MNKKIILGLGALAAVATPVAAVVSCGVKKNTIVKLNGLEERDKIGNYKFVKPTGRKIKIAMVASGPTAQKNDHSFNESIYNAIKDYYKANDIAGEPAFINPASSKPSDLRAAYNTAFQSADIVIGAGNEHQTALEGSNYRPPAGKGLIIDGIDVKKDYVASLLFRINEPSFMAGLAASMYLNKHKDKFAKDGHLKAGAYGGQDVAMIPHFIAGFQQGIKYFNEHIKKDSDKEVEWIDLGSRSDYFSGSWAPGGGTAISSKLINKGADVILAAAGPQTLDTLNVIRQRKSDAVLVGVDSPMEDNPSYQESGVNKHILFSIIQDAKNSLSAIIDSVINNSNDAAHMIYGFGGLSIGGSINKFTKLSSTANSLVSKTNATDIYTVLDKDDVIRASQVNSLEWDI